MMFQEQSLPASVPTVASLTTSRARTANGGVVSTTGRSTPGDNGAASYIYRKTGRSLISTDNGAYLPGPGADDYWEVTRKDVLNFAIYGADNTDQLDSVRSYMAIKWGLVF